MVNRLSGKDDGRANYMRKNKNKQNLMILDMKNLPECHVYAKFKLMWRVRVLRDVPHFFICRYYLQYEPLRIPIPQAR